MAQTVLAVHGGAGPIRRETLAAEWETAGRAALADALHAGSRILRQGGAALDAVVRAVTVLEDHDCFNAGRGAVLAADGSVELDAAVMDGRAKRAGAVAGLRTVRNPIAAARLVLDRSPHVVLHGAGAETFARTEGLATAGPSYFVTPHRRAQWETARAAGRVRLDHDTPGTVGAVACDAQGHVAAATSTGGMLNKWPGRMSDSAIIGAGTWADDATCAVSATGHGEAFIQTAFAHEVDAGMRLGGLDLATACARALDRVRTHGGRGGCVAVDARGNLALPFTTSGMYRGWLVADGAAQVAIFPDDDMRVVRE